MDGIGNVCPVRSSRQQLIEEILSVRKNQSIGIQIKKKGMHEIRINS